MKARNQGNTVAATNPVFDLLMTFNDLYNNLHETVLNMALGISNKS